MKKTLSLAVLILLIWNQPSFAESNWFNQKPTQSQPVEPVGPKVGDAIPIPKTVDPQTNQSAAVLLKQPCDGKQFQPYTGKQPDYGSTN